MAYDPTLPANGAPIVSAELRDQFAGLNDLINDRVVAADLDGIMAGFCAGNVPTAAVGPLAMTVSNPPTRAQVQAIADRLDLILSYLQRV